MSRFCGLRKTAVLALLALALSAPQADAQENLDAGKSPAQLFASDCSLCHKSSRGLSKSGGLFGLTGFLREHYTASRETAAALAAYLQQIDAERPAEKPRQARRSKPASKPKDADKPGESKAGEKKTEEAKKPAEATPAETKPTEAKPVEAKPVEAKPAESKDTQSASSKPAGEAKSAAESKASADKPADAKSDKKE